MKFHLSCLSEIFKARPSLVVLLLMGIVSAQSSKSLATEPLVLHGSLSLNTQKVLTSFEQIGQNTVAFGEVIPAFRTDGEIPADLQNIEFKINLSNLKAAITPDGQIIADLGQARASVHISKLNINTVLEKHINGAIFYIRVNAECSNLSAQIDVSNSAIRMNAADLIPLSLPNASSLQIEMGNSQVTLGDMNCTGVTGIEGMIGDELKKVLQNRILIQEIVQKKLKEKIEVVMSEQKKQLNDIIDSILKKADETATVHISKVLVSDKMIKVDLIAQVAKENSLIVKKVSLKDLVPDLKGNVAALAVNKSEFENFLVNASLRTQKINRLSSNNIPALKKLTNSRFQQFFIWPALMKRPKGKELILVPGLESLDIVLPKNKITTNLEYNLKVGTWIVDENRPMVYLRTSGQASSKLSENSSAVALGLSSLNTSTIWDKAYLKLKGCSTRIATSILDKVAPAALLDHFAKLNLNLFSVPLVGKIQVKSFELNNDDQLTLNIDQTK